MIVHSIFLHQIRSIRFLEASIPIFPPSASGMTPGTRYVVMRLEGLDGKTQDINLWDSEGLEVINELNIIDELTEAEPSEPEPTEAA